MKSLKTMLFYFIAIGLLSCAKEKNDIADGLSINTDGLTFEKAYIAGDGDRVVDHDNIPMDGKIAVVLQGVQNYVLKDGNAFPGLNITVTDRNGNAIIDDADLLGNKNGYSPEEASIVRGTVRTGAPMVRGETYHVKMKLWDHNKPENQILTELDIVPR